MKYVPIYHIKLFLTRDVQNALHLHLYMHLVRKSFMWCASTYFFYCISHLLMYFEESETMDSNMEIKRFRTHVHITQFRLLSVRNVSWSLCRTFCYTLYSAQVFHNNMYSITLHSAQVFHNYTSYYITLYSAVIFHKSHGVILFEIVAR